MTERDELFSIVDLAARTGLSVKTIRFWSDEGLVPPATRSAAGYRLYDAEAVARLELVHTLRTLGLDVKTVRSVLAQQTSLAEVADAHARALDAEIRTLRVRRAVLRSVATRNSTTEELRIMHEMATLSAAERQRIIDEFVDEAFAGIAPEAPGAHIATGMRSMPAVLPDDPTPTQVDAWIELAALVSDPEFRARAREMAVTGAQATEPPVMVDLEAARGPAEAGTDPASAEAGALLEALLPVGTDRAAMADQMVTFTDARVERYWSLLGVLNGWPPRPAMVTVALWVIAALRAHP
ncbi:Transcriptional regulator, MerR family OS=Tsukamurella paurometabola (strain ATCC 8368 / DSM/ CCUG 35730 / CIP 100753 / JCM 10117 / KCTC 9821 / NBRC 16120/ NCIMB 702349 / NCTC 13040) OX=521096 GN=Tpau_1614 PE=4 SV=1 [Tsukamurella paurometabola]|uniref:Transcriptional regulator, MerR family n=1 Tax=Tsukamurella paurometabola (strain ATCC 8368 / DSM 20162 / CCUG 35730 / CIP 100753 / JCM 10117 / KCTC 9821 / NBRC 16120 / NCIMB 702349 / NCTC 13040) TaxID=521096 RepID=D5UYC8_TSUPD|nr:MerR family transcriptional regulator [Tsukamurella paurometabola]ADG78235.1 transcriptional regulator, MerR family [Tsukamurella paurometabola DSM 20162]SUP30806.1 Mercuric resistance operon regulatory protein [Tsukamurella paurometabola]